MSKELYFKKGDIVVPIKGRKSSNDYKFSKDLILKSLQNIETNKTYYGYEFEIVEGYACLLYGTKYVKGQRIYVYPNAFQLQNEMKELYPIF